MFSRVELDPALVEEAVLQASDAAPPLLHRRYRRERNAVYEIRDPEAREAAFRELDDRWFRKLGLGSRLLELLAEFEPVFTGVSRCLVLPAVRSKDEGADLHQSRGPAPTLAVKLTPSSLLDFERVAPLLRRELVHVEDMLDPAFGYTRESASPGGDPAYEKLVRDRYRILWTASVDGRLHARGRLPAGAEARCRREFLSAFSRLGSGADRQFQRLFFGPRPSHDELLALARSLDGHASGFCPLCRFPTARLRKEPIDLSVEERIRQDFGGWSSSQGICAQCADLYEARASSALCADARFRCD